ncbi:MAG: metal ABC transporter permease [Candidatus Harrisonbacteria bacterium]|nr:metal ABC transporter permease [Candidatus Harrisonbacteria bacterium]MBI2406132.1 metal ABC transporter permease [Candidatus Harrisonbacteria bacterium]MBI3114334.1 metal ABC transporter permease [Candidatus Harrisonbacteria bacterium]
MTENIPTIVLMLAVAAASGLVGVFALMRKMTLASDAISHIALPGLGLAVLLKINPLIGGAAALFLGVLLIWSIERKTEISTETVIGVMFSASLAVGSLLTPDEELIEVLFGGVRAPALAESIIGIIAATAVIVFIVRMKERLTLALVSEDLATVSGVSVSRMNLLFLLVFALNVILGLQFLGVLLMGSLIIVPAAVARNLGKSLGSTLASAVAAAMFSVGAGYAVAAAYELALGPAIISIAAALFFGSLFVARKG